MRELTKQMISEFKIYELGYDFMAYGKQNGDLISFHHLIVPKRLCQEDELKGYYRWNGALLYTTSHQYLHTIEAYDLDVFNAITSEMIDINTKGYLDKDNLRYIDDCLGYFEREHIGHVTNKGRPLIREEYLNRRKF